jgi:hypothetical protein
MHIHAPGLSKSHRNHAETRSRLCGTPLEHSIYHKHFSYFSFVTIEPPAERHGMKIIDAKKVKSHGGSLRVYLAHHSAARMASPRVMQPLEHEVGLGFLDVDGYARFVKQVQCTKRKLLSFLITCKERGQRIAGYGAPGNGNTPFNYCGIGFFDFTVDRNPYKHGRFTPGTHVPGRQAP